MTKYNSVEEFRQEIIRKHETLSKRLKQVSRYILDHPNDVAIETLAVIAERCGGQASTIVRFAKAFDFDSASQMQRLFRNELLNNSHNLDYNERIRRSYAKKPLDINHPIHLLEEFTESNKQSLKNLKATIRQADLQNAIKMITEANTIYIIGFRRSFPVATYLTYALQKTNKRCILIDNIGGLSKGQTVGITSEDLMIAISYHRYTKETLDIVSEAAEHTDNIIAITDSPVSPIATLAKVSFEVKEAEVRQFRSLNASLCLAQVLVIGHAYQSEKASPSVQ